MLCNPMYKGHLTSCSCLLTPANLVPTAASWPWTGQVKKPAIRMQAATPPLSRSLAHSLTHSPLPVPFLVHQDAGLDAGRSADAVQAATTALEAAIRLIRPGSKSSDVSATLQKVSSS